MDVVKRFSRGFCSQLFKFSIVVLAVSAATGAVLGSPDTLKDSLKESGIYTSVVDGIIDQAKNEQGDQSTDENEVPIDDPAVQTAIKNALPPDFLEQTSTQAIDGIFGWLQGKTETPQFNIDLTQAKQRLAAGVADVAYQRAVALPPCTLAQLQTLDQNNLDIFNLPCLPPGLNAQAERDKLQNQIANSGDVLKDTTVSADDLPKENGQNAFEQADAVPTAYQWLVRLPWILAGLAVVSAAGLCLLHDDRRRALFLLARAAFVVGTVLLVGVVLTNFLTGQIKPENGQALQATAIDLARDLIGQFNNVLIKFGAGYGILGAAGLLALHFTKPKTLEQTGEQTETTNAPANTPQTESEPTKTDTK